jgi:signal-transduction protein with cAMP-binding, CBS, and nucleotidyltransferase domain
MKKNKIHRIIVEDMKVSTFTGFITYETIFDFFIANYYSDMNSFRTPASSLDVITKKVITVDKDETLYNCLLKLWFHKISIIPVMHGTSLFGFLFLKDILYLFGNGEKFAVKRFNLDK